MLSRALVVGLFESKQPRAPPHDAGVLTVLTHKDPGLRRRRGRVRAGRGAGPDHEEPPTPAAFCEELALAAAVHDKELAEELRHLPRLLTWDTGARSASCAR